MDWSKYKGEQTQQSKQIDTKLGEQPMSSGVDLSKYSRKSTENNLLDTGIYENNSISNIKYKNLDAQTLGIKQPLPNKIGDYLGQILPNMKKEMQKGADIINAPAKNFPERALNTALGLTSGFTGAVMEPINKIVFEPVAKTLTPGLKAYYETITPEPLKEAISTVGQETGKKLYDITKNLTEEQKQKLDSAGNIVDFSLTAGIGGMAGKLKNIKIPEVPMKIENILSKESGKITKDVIENTIPKKPSILSAEGIIGRINKTDPSFQPEFFQKYKKTVPEYLLETVGAETTEKTIYKLTNRFKESMRRVDKGLELIKGTYKSPAILNVLQESIDFAVRTMDKKLPKLKEYIKKYSETGLNMSEINDIKRFFEQKFKLPYLQSTDTIKKELAKNIDTSLREWQQRVAEINGMPELKALNKETQMAKDVLDELGKKYLKQTGNNAITLTDWILASQAINSPKALTGIIAKKTFGSEAFQVALAKLLSRNKKTKELTNINLENIAKKNLERDIKKLNKYPQLPAPKENYNAPKIINIKPTILKEKIKEPIIRVNNKIISPKQKDKQLLLPSISKRNTQSLGKNKPRIAPTSIQKSKESIKNNIKKTEKKSNNSLKKETKKNKLPKKTKKNIIKKK